jgi:hypothetical protein
MLKMSVRAQPCAKVCENHSPFHLTYFQLYMWYAKTDVSRDRFDITVLNNVIMWPRSRGKLEVQSAPCSRSIGTSHHGWSVGPQLARSGLLYLLCIAVVRSRLHHGRVGHIRRQIQVPHVYRHGKQWQHLLWFRSIIQWFFFIPSIVDSCCVIVSCVCTYFDLYCESV